MSENQEMEERPEKEVTERTTVVYFAYNPCSFLQEALNAILKCLGLDSAKPKDSSSPEDSDNKVNEPSFQESPSNTGEAVDPPCPSTTTDPAADPPSTSVEDAARAPRPPVNSGSGPSTN